MKEDGACGCGHLRLVHQQKEPSPCKSRFYDDEGRWTRCHCPGFDSAVLPAPGERLEFGKHRITAPEAETAPAWTPIRVTETIRPKRRSTPTSTTGSAEGVA